MITKKQDEIEMNYLNLEKILEQGVQQKYKHWTSMTDSQRKKAKQTQSPIDV